MNKLLLLFIALVIVFLCISCGNSDIQEYYLDKTNYITASGTVSFISYSNDGSALYIGFTNLSFAFDDSCFKIVGDNLLAVKERGIDEKLVIGSDVSFVTAPKYFGDGYVMPIISITANGKMLLTTDEGYINLINWLSEQ